MKQLTLITDGDGDIIASSTYQRLARHRPCLLPSLEDLSCPSALPTHIPLFSLLSPALECLKLGGNQAAYDELIEPALSTITSESEKSRLSLKWLFLHGNSPMNLFSSLYQFSNLLQLSISAEVSIESFKAAGKLVNLENLAITLPAFPEPPVGELGFGNLQTLYIKSPFPSLEWVLREILTPRLSSVSITAVCLLPDLDPTQARLAKKKKRPMVTRFPAYNAFAECFEILNSRWRLSLESITVDQDESLYPFDNHMPSDLFSRLSCFEKLRNLQFHHFHPTDTGIHSLALACPNLRKLYLPLDCPNPSDFPGSVSTFPNTTLGDDVGQTDVDDIELFQSRTATTIVALWSFAELCPSLTHLQIGLDITTCTIPPFFDSAVYSHSLIHLSVGSYYQLTNIGPTHTFEIARHIDRLFPNLEIESHHGHNSTVWDQIGYAVDAYKKVRLDENTRRLKKQREMHSQSTNFLSH